MLIWPWNNLRGLPDFSGTVSLAHDSEASTRDLGFLNYLVINEGRRKAATLIATLLYYSTKKINFHQTLLISCRCLLVNPLLVKELRLRENLFLMNRWQDNL